MFRILQFFLPNKWLFDEMIIISLFTYTQSWIFFQLANTHFIVCGLALKSELGIKPIVYWHTALETRMVPILWQRLVQFPPKLTVKYLFYLIQYNSNFMIRSKWGQNIYGKTYFLLKKINKILSFNIYIRETTWG